MAWEGLPRCSPLGREDVLGCLELIVFGTFCVCGAANSGAICLCSQPQSPGINKFSSVVLKESFSGGGERGGRSRNHLVSEEEALARDGTDVRLARSPGAHKNHVRLL